MGAKWSDLSFGTHALIYNETIPTKSMMGNSLAPPPKNIGPAPAVSETLIMPMPWEIKLDVNFSNYPCEWRQRRPPANNMLPLPATATAPLPYYISIIWHSLLLSRFGSTVCGSVWCLCASSCVYVLFSVYVKSGSANSVAILSPNWSMYPH